jgi:mevalonate kinase
MITVSVPGKIHLMGEHAVVYGKPALLSAINKRMRVSIEQASKMDIVTTESPACITYALEKVRQYLKLDACPPVRISIDSDIPAGFHLGSSAATAVGVVAASMYFLKKLWDLTQINAIAYEVEKKQHGNPSGGDNTAITFGGLVWFRKELEFLKSMHQLDITIPSILNHFFLINTGRPKETTGEMVAYVRSKVAAHPSQYKKIFDENEEQTKKIVIAMKEGNEKNLVDGIKRGEQTLERMGVVSKQIVPTIRAIEKAGGAAKILGGGGRTDGVGFLLCYHKNQKTVENLCAKHKFEIQKIQLGEEGVRLEKRSNV